MKKNNLICSVKSLVILPTMVVSIIFPSTDNVKISQNVLIQKFNIEANRNIALNQAIDLEATKDKARAEAIDAYLKARNMPLDGFGMKMVIEAKKNDLDWRLLPAIAIRESTGGKFACKKSPANSFGWGSCKISFDSNEEAIETVARNLGGNEPKTDHHYAGKNTKQILQKYNPPSVVPKYADQVMSIMESIGEENLGETDTNIEINTNT